MKKSFRYRLSILWLGLLFISISCKEDISSKEQDPFWNSLDKAYEQSSNEGRFIFVDVWAEWCHPCKIMDKEIYQLPEYRTLIASKYLPVRLNLDQKEKILCSGKTDTPYRCLDLHWQLRGVPLALILNSNGDVLNYRMGQMNTQEFKLFLAEPLTNP